MIFLKNHDTSREISQETARPFLAPNLPKGPRGCTKQPASSSAIPVLPLLPPVERPRICTRHPGSPGGIVASETAFLLLFPYEKGSLLSDPCEIHPWETSSSSGWHQVLQPLSQDKLLGQVVMAHTFNPSTGSTELVPGQLRLLHRETLS
ncbi:protein FAM104B isoform X4 [Cricetulus griseus]|uniref:protein FAM104B isoform X4 n=1 Tax=Cricetulus griseus TaxID=10029 RepID=UPI000F73856F|nr:protein FAM104B isoform X4 [Cricetulus griseus]